jgi:hypothetical protein
MRRFLLGILLALVLLTPPSRADDAHEFIMSASYGLIAGTFIGVASLAFESQPGLSLNNVARGASLGLYAGILLGLYVVFAVPDANERDPLGHVSITPTISPQSRVDGLETHFRLLSF